MKNEGINGINKDKLLNQAIHFAVERHEGQLRKCTKVPYITHPLETLSILNYMKSDMNLLIAGVLHDTVEDTDTTKEEIKELFGEDVAELVLAHSEDKSKTWQERKVTSIEEVKIGSTRLKKLVLADKVANLRSMYVDQREIGDELWKRFNAPKEKQEWYYKSMLEALIEMKNYLETRDIYLEMEKLYKGIFEE